MQRGKRARCLRVAVSAIIASGGRIATTSCGAIVERYLQQRSAVRVAGLPCAVTRQVPDPTRVVSCADLHAHISSCVPPPSAPQDATIVGQEAPCHCGAFRREWHMQVSARRAQQVAPASTRGSSAGYEVERVDILVGRGRADPAFERTIPHGGQRTKNRHLFASPDMPRGRLNALWQYTWPSLGLFRRSLALRDQKRAASS